MQPIKLPSWLSLRTRKGEDEAEWTQDNSIEFNQPSLLNKNSRRNRPMSENEEKQLEDYILREERNDDKRSKGWIGPEEELSL